MADERNRPQESRGPAASKNPSSPAAGPACRPACPVCGGRLIEIRAKLQCSQCHTIIETCCEGGPEGP